MENVYNGGMLTGNEILRNVNRGDIIIDPFDPKCINPNSYNLKLHPQLLVYNRMPNGDSFNLDNCYDAFREIAALELEPLDMRKENLTVQLTIPEEGLVLHPGILYIGRTVERTATDKFIPMINGRSSGGRLGISIHVCAGFGDIGFDGTWTLEITVVEPVRVYPYAEIAQVCYFTPVGDVSQLYNGRYQHQEDATASRFHKPKEEM